MIENRFIPEKVFVEQAVFDLPYTREILERIPNVPVQVISDSKEIGRFLIEGSDPIAEAKKCLLINSQKGEFVKPCPCTPRYLGCNYYVINLDLNCPMDCSYCILQFYLEHPLITIPVNKVDLWRQLSDFLSANKERRIRIGTGELGDSLAMDHITHRSVELIEFFRRWPKAYLELKTKTTNIGNILKTDPANNIIIAWSLNSESRAEAEEHGAPPVKERIRAAREVVDRGYRVAFHFDPIIYTEDWEKGYKEVIDNLFRKVEATRIAWISIGSLRFPPALKSVIKRRFPQSGIIYEEFIKGLDGKNRYFKPKRMEMYRKIVNWMQQKGGENLPLYFCMESCEIWEKCLHVTLRGKESVEKHLTLPLNG